MSEDWAAMTAAACDPTTPPEQLRTLAHNNLLRLLVAANPAAPPDLLAQFVTSRNWHMSAIVAGNPNTPLDTLLKLALGFPEEFLRNPILPLAVIERPRLFYELPARVAWKLLRCEVITPEQVALFLKHNDNQVQMYARLHPLRTQAWTLAIWEAETRAIVRCYDFAAVPQDCNDILTALAHPVAPWLVEWLSGHSSTDVRTFVTRLPGLAPEQYMILAHDPSETVRAWLALNPDMPPACIPLLLHDTNSNVKSAVIHCARLDEADAIACATSSHEYMHNALAENPYTQYAQLALLVNSDSKHVRAVVARHPNMPPVAFAALLLDSPLGPEIVRARDPATPQAQLLELAGSLVPEIRMAAVGNPALPHDMLLWRALDQDKRVRAAVAENPRLTLDAATVAELNKRAPREAALFLAAHPNLPVALIADLLRHDVEVVTALAANPAVPLTMLRPLLEASHPTIRATLARRARLPRAWMQHLAGDQEFQVRAALAQNPHFALDGAVLRQLVKRGEAERETLAMAPTTPQDILHDLCGYVTLPVGLALLRHPNADDELRRNVREQLLSQLAMHRNELLRLIILALPDVPGEALAQAAHAPAWLVRLMAARHPATPRALLTKLARDGTAPVRFAAQERLADD